MRISRAIGIATGLCWAFTNIAVAAGIGTSALLDPAAASGMAAPAADTVAANRAAASLGCPERGIELRIMSAVLCSSIDDPHAIPQPLLRDWIERAARTVAAYYAQFPAQRLLLRIQVSEGGGVHGGRTTNEAGLVIQVDVGRHVTSDELAQDWVLVHEMVHLALPALGRSHHWLEEGLATYVEGIARAQSGNRDITDVWAEYRRSMPLGLPRAGEGGMDETPTWGRTYWGGALYCLQADVALREQTGNRAGLQTALRAILKETKGYAGAGDINEVLRIGDAATGTRVLQDLYLRSKTTPLAPDLNLLWGRLGVPNDPKSQPFDDHAPLAAIRLAITARQPEPPER